MIIQLDDATIGNRENEEWFYDSLELLMICYSEGNHIIVISPKSVMSLLSDSNITGSTHFRLKHYSYHFAKESKQYLKCVKFITKIVPCDSREYTYKDNENNSFVTALRLDKFKRTQNIQPTSLLCENQSDTNVYNMMGYYYIKKMKIDNVFRIKCDPKSGGGDTTHQTFEQIYCAYDNYCLCFLDSDKKTPKHDVGQTAKKVLKIANAEDVNLRCKVYVLSNALELENILPSQFYSKIYGDNENLITNQFKKKEKTAIRYFDFKKGIHCKSIQANDEKAQYWKKVLGISFEPTCFSDEKFEKEIKCQIVPGFGGKILENFNEFCDKEDIISIIFASDTYIQRQWNIIGLYVTSYCCGTIQKRAI